MANCTHVHSGIFPLVGETAPIIAVEATPDTRQLVNLTLESPDLPTGHANSSLPPEEANANNNSASEVRTNVNKKKRLYIVFVNFYANHLFGHYLKL